MEEILNLLKAIAAKLGVAPLAPVAAPAAASWWKPTDVGTVNFAASIGWTPHDLNGNRQANGSKNDPKVKPSDGSEDGAKAYAAFGFAADGARALYDPGDRAAAQKVADRLASAGGFQAANDIIAGAGGPGVTTDLAIYLVMTGMTTGGGLLGTPRLYNLGWTTIASHLANPTGGGGEAGTF